MNPIDLAVLHFPLEALRVGFSPVGKQTMLTIAQTLGPQRISADASLANARKATGKKIAGSRLPSPVEMKAKVAIAQNLKSPAALKASGNSFQKSLSKLTVRVRELKAASENVRTSEKTFQSRKASTNNPKVARVKASAGRSLGRFELKVDQLAQVQRNEGKEIPRENVTALDSGRQFFEITKGDESKRVSTFVEPGSGVEVSLKKMARAIERSNLGLTAEVMSVGEGESVRLTVSSVQTGSESGFSIKDISGNLVEKSGANNVVQSASNASFSLNGNESTLQENNFVVDGGRLELTLMQPGQAEVEIQRDSEPIVESADKLVGEINQFRGMLGESSGLVNEDVAVEFDNHLTDLSQKLQSIGISVDSVGAGEELSLSVDFDALTAATETQTEDVEQILSGTDGLATRMEGFAQVFEQGSAIELVGLSDQELGETSAATMETGVSGSIVDNAL